MVVTHRSRRPLVATIAVLVALSVSLSFGRGTDATSLTKILDGAGQYARRFEEGFSVVIADEAYTQELYIQGDRSTVRRIRSEMLFMWVPEDHEWLSVRNVLAVDGREVPDSASRLESALKDPLPGRASRLHRLAEESARFNVGSIHRNFNSPTLALQFVDPSYQPRFKFMLDNDGREKRMGGVLVRRVTYAELQRPTVVRDGDENLFSNGALWLRVSDGTIVRTSQTLTAPRTHTQASIAVDYRRDPRLDMWVPSHMEERYASHVLEHHLGALNGKVSRLNEIICGATYSHFRRFETAGRVVAPK